MLCVRQIYRTVYVLSMIKSQYTLNFAKECHNYFIKRTISYNMQINLELAMLFLNEYPKV